MIRNKNRYEIGGHFADSSNKFQLTTRIFTEICKQIWRSYREFSAISNPSGINLNLRSLKS